MTAKDSPEPTNDVSHNSVDTPLSDDADHGSTEAQNAKPEDLVDDRKETEEESADPNHESKDSEEKSADSPIESEVVQETAGEAPKEKEEDQESEGAETESSKDDVTSTTQDSKNGEDSLPDPSTDEPSKNDESSIPWADRWWVWALGGLAFALFILLMHVTS